MLPIAAVLTLLTGCLAFYVHSRQQARAVMQENMNQVETVQVTKQNLIDSISVTGTIKSADEREVQSIAKDVEVLEVRYKVGDYVNEGDVVVVLDSSELERSLTEAQNSQALSQYKENKSIETATEDYNEAVEDGTDEYQSAQEKAADAKEALQEAEDELAGAASRLKRREESLNEANSAQEAAAAVLNGLAETDEGYKDAKDAYEAAAIAAQEAQSSYTEAHQAYNTAAEAEEKAVETYESAVDQLETAEKNNDRNISSAEDNLEQVQKEHEYSNDSGEQTIENYQDQIESCTVTAPVSGIITAMNVDAGDTYMGEGNVLFSVADEKNFIVSASVDEYDISSIDKDMEAAVIVEALGDEELPATVSFVSPSADESNMGSSSYSIEIALDDENTDLRIGMTAKASIILNAVYDVLTVPYDCVETDEDGNSVLYIDKDGEKTPVQVEVGMESDYYVEVSGEGLDETTMIYYTNPMTQSNGTSGNDESTMTVTMPGMMGGGAPSGGGRPGGGF